MCFSRSKLRHFRLLPSIDMAHPRSLVCEQSQKAGRAAIRIRHALPSRSPIPRR